MHRQFGLCQHAAQQIIGREAETATFIQRNFFNLTLRVVGFRPRQFNRWAAILEIERANKTYEIVLA